MKALEASAAYERAVTFLREVEERVATRTEPWRWGTAFFNADYPLKYAQNYLRIDIDDPTATAVVMSEEAERVQGSAGLRHRRVNGYGASAERHAEGFAALGWEVSRMVLMTHDGEIRSWPKKVEVEVRELPEIRDTQFKWDLEESGFTDEVAAQLADSRHALLKAVDLEIFAGVIDGDNAGWCELYRRAGVAQIENVMTFSPYRNRGVAASVVNRALEEVHAAGSEIAFLIADDDDWPKEFYGRLGFTPVGRLAEFTKQP